MIGAAAASRTVIRPGRGALRLSPRELWGYRELLYFMVWRDAKVRYRQTVLGALWSVVQPLATMVVFSVVFGKYAGVPSDGIPYPIFSFAALVPWTYFSTALASSANSLVGSQQLISKVYFPRVLVPAGAVLTPLIDFGIAFLILVAMLIGYGGAPSAGALACVPLFVLLALLTALAAGLWFSALNVEYRDVRVVLPFVMQFWMFATPVAYPASLFPDRWRPLYGLNPMSTVVEGMRWSMFGTPAPGAMSLLSAAVVAAALWGGIAYFRRMEGTFADVI